MRDFFDKFVATGITDVWAKRNNIDISSYDLLLERRAQGRNDTWFIKYLISEQSVDEIKQDIEIDILKHGPYK